MYEENILFLGYYSTIVNDSDVDVATSSDADEVFQVEYSSETDASLYTVQVVNDTPLTTAEQSAVYLLEIRNLILIFVLCYVVLNLYSKLKNTFVNFFGKE